MGLSRLVYVLSRMWIVQEFYQLAKRYTYNLTSPVIILNIDVTGVYMDSISCPSFLLSCRAGAFPRVVNVLLRMWYDQGTWHTATSCTKDLSHYTSFVWYCPHIGIGALSKVISICQEALAMIRHLLSPFSALVILTYDRVESLLCHSYTEQVYLSRIAIRRIVKNMNCPRILSTCQESMTLWCNISLVPFSGIDLSSDLHSKAQLYPFMLTRVQRERGEAPFQELHACWSRM